MRSGEYRFRPSPFALWEAEFPRKSFVGNSPLCIKAGAFGGYGY